MANQLLWQAQFIRSFKIFGAPIWAQVTTNILLSRYFKNHQQNPWSEDGWFRLKVCEIASAEGVSKYIVCNNIWTCISCPQNGYREWSQVTKHEIMWRLAIIICSFFSGIHSNFVVLSSWLMKHPCTTTCTRLKTTTKNWFSSKEAAPKKVKYCPFSRESLNEHCLGFYYLEKVETIRKSRYALLLDRRETELQEKYFFHHNRTPAHSNSHDRPSFGFLRLLGICSPV